VCLIEDDNGVIEVERGEACADSGVDQVVVGQENDVGLGHAVATVVVRAEVVRLAKVREVLDV
jgi:hypothetical protein